MYFCAVITLWENICEEWGKIELRIYCLKKLWPLKNINVSFCLTHNPNYLYNSICNLWGKMFIYPLQFYSMLTKDIKCTVINWNNFLLQTSHFDRLGSSNANFKFYFLLYVRHTCNIASAWKIRKVYLSRVRIWNSVLSKCRVKSYNKPCCAMCISVHLSDSQKPPDCSAFQDFKRELEIARVFNESWNNTFNP